MAPDRLSPPPRDPVLVVAEAAMASVLAAGIGGAVTTVCDAVAFAEAFVGPPPGAVIVALGVPWAEGAAVITSIRRRFVDVEIVVMGEVSAPGVLAALLEARVVQVVPASIEGVAALFARWGPPGRRACVGAAPGAAADALPDPVVVTLRAELAALRGELDAAREASGAPRFAAEVAHDLREPARSGRLLLERMDAALAAGEHEAAAALVARLYDANARLEDLVDGALADLRGRAPSEAIARSHADHALDEVLDQLAALLAETHGIVTRDALPEVSLHPHQLRQILQNLVANALRYGGDPPRIHVSAARDGDRWILAVADNGPGIPVEQREAIFRPLTRLAAAGAPMGHGLGLSICRKVVERAQGRIWVEPASGGGSVFFVSLPAAEEPAGRIVAPPSVVSSPRV